MTTSGTTSLMLSLLSLNIGLGDEVIVPNYTMIATINSIVSVGATPVIVDIDSKSFTMTLNNVKEFITDKTKVILHVSLNNRCSGLLEMVNFCKENSIYLVEDSAQSMGCFYDGKHLGTYGTIGCFSLSTPKIISTGQGGFIITDNDSVASKARKIKNFGRKESGNDNYDCIGYNFKYTDLQAVIGLEQLKKLPERVSRMKEIYHLYYTQLHSMYNIPEKPYLDWFPWFMDILVEDRDSLSMFLSSHNIGTRPTYPLISKTEMYKNLYTYPNAKKVCQQGLFLPSYTNLTDKDIFYICVILKLYYLSK